jgi:putative transposase
MSHTYSQAYMHAVFGTKGRRDLISLELEKRLYSFLVALGKKSDMPILAAGGIANHSHLLFLLPGTVTVSSAVNVFKTNSSRFMHEQRSDFAWQSGYAAFSVSRSQVERVVAYIKGQHEHHRKMTFEDEFLGMLKRAGLSYDPEFVFE